MDSDDTVPSKTGNCKNHSLAAFTERLRDICENDGDCDGAERSERISNQAKHALVVAAEFGCLKEPDFSWDDFVAEGVRRGTEHVVDLSVTTGLVAKTTIPPGFGLVPVVRQIPILVANPDSEDPREREVIEFVDATPLEYLSRWQASNEVFGDEVKLVSVIRWKEGKISFGITQPQYHGEPAEPRDIERFFHEAGWTRLKDPSGHVVFFNHAFSVMAIDVEKRNCYINDAGLQPFDVILCQPTAEMEKFLNIYPD